jgi:hypothetical protein
MAIACLLIAALPREQCLRDVVDVIEVNHVVDGNSDLVFDQWIAWRWVVRESHFRVVAWRILKDVRESPKQLRRAPDGWQPRPKWVGGHASPLKRHDRGGWWFSQWYDEKDKCWREVAAPMYRETTTLYDPEVEDRSFLPMDRRMGLRSPHRRSPPVKEDFP